MKLHSYYAGLTAMTALANAIPAPAAESSKQTLHLVARKVKPYKTPWSTQGTCNAYGSCSFNSGGGIPARCKNSQCDKEGSPCTVAYTDTAPGPNDDRLSKDKEAKCPVNTAGYEWEWPWVDHAWLDAYNEYSNCIDEAKKIKDKGQKKAAKKKCEEIQGGPA